MPSIPIPTIGVDGSFDEDPLASTFAWNYDLKPYFLSASIKRGRQRSIGNFEAGTCRLTLLNTDRRFDPWHTSGPYGSSFRPGKKIRITNTVAGVGRFRFAGTIERIVPRWPDGGAAPFCVVDLVDGFKSLARKKLLTTGYQPSVLSKNPRAYYRMDDAGDSAIMLDKSPNARHGSYTGRNKASVDGAITGDNDTALDCGNAAGSATGAVAAGLNGSGTKGVELFVKLNALPAGGDFYTVFDQTIGGGGERLALRILDTGVVRVNEVANVLDSSATVAADGNWHYICFTKDGSSVLRLRVNDASVVTSLVAPWTYAQNAPVIGYDIGLATRKFNGQVDEVAIYDGTVPSDAETLAHFQEGREGSWSGQYADDRITALLDALGWPASRRAILGAGTYELAPVTSPLGAQSVLAHMQAVSLTEGGLLYMNEADQLQFVPEFGLGTPPSTFTLGEDTAAGEVPYHEAPDADYSDSEIGNEIDLQGDAVSRLLLRDQSSIDDYEVRTLTQSGLLFRHAADMSTRALRLLTMFASPKKRLGAVKVSTTDDTVNSINMICTTTMGHTITVKRRPIGGGSAISVPSMVEGIQDEITPERWDATFKLSPW